MLRIGRKDFDVNLNRNTGFLEDLQAAEGQFDKAPCA